MSLELPVQFGPSKAMNSADRAAVIRERKVVVLKSMVVGFGGLVEVGLE
jgi:hypothetical protein